MGSRPDPVFEDRIQSLQFFIDIGGVAHPVFAKQSKLVLQSVTGHRL